MRAACAWLAAPFTYIVWLFVLDGVQLGIAGAILRGPTLLIDARRIWRYGVVAALGSILSFGVLLYAMDLTEVARVSALRESAVVFGALFGWVFPQRGVRRAAGRVRQCRGRRLSDDEPLGSAMHPAHRARPCPYRP